MLPVMRALDARIQDATAPLQGSKLPRLLTEDFGSGGVLFEGESCFYQPTHKGMELLAESLRDVGAFFGWECLRTSSARPFPKKKLWQASTLSPTARTRTIAPARVRRRRETMQITWAPTSSTRFQ